jgi:hypothetical protein
MGKFSTIMVSIFVFLLLTLLITSTIDTGNSFTAGINVTGHRYFAGGK